MKDVELRQLPRVSVSISRKVNLGHYESCDVFVSLACDEPKELTALLERCKREVEAFSNNLREEWDNGHESK